MCIRIPERHIFQLYLFYKSIGRFLFCDSEIFFAQFLSNTFSVFNKGYTLHSKVQSEQVPKRILKIRCFYGFYVLVSEVTH